MSENSPQNYLNKVHLLDAELAAAHNKTVEAVLHFKKAISFSNKHGFPHEEALCYERLGIFYSQINSPKASCESLMQSFACYGKWGAREKLVYLRTKHPFVSKWLDNDSSSMDFELQLQNSSSSVTSSLTENSEQKVKNLKKYSS